MAIKINSKFVKFTYGNHKTELAELLQAIVDYGALAFITGYDGTWPADQDATYKPSPEILKGNVIFAKGVWYGTSKSSLSDALNELGIGHAGREASEGVEAIEPTGLFKSVKDLQTDVEGIHYFNAIKTASADNEYSYVMGATKPGATLEFKGEGSASISLANGAVTFTGATVDTQNSEKFKIGDATYSLVYDDATKKFKISKVEYAAPVLTLTASPASNEYESGNTEITLKTNYTAGKGYGELPTAASVNGVGPVLENGQFKQLTTNTATNKTYTLTYRYLDTDGLNVIEKTTTASVSFNQYRWYVGTTEPTTTDNIKGGTLKTGLQQVATTPGDGVYTYVAIPSKFASASKTEGGNTPGNNPVAFKFTDASTGLAGGWLYWSTISGVYSDVDYYVYRTVNPNINLKFNIAKA